MTNRYVKIVALLLAALMLFVGCDAVLPDSLGNAIECEKPTEHNTESTIQIPTQPQIDAPTDNETDEPTQNPTESPVQAPTEPPAPVPTEAPTLDLTEGPLFTSDPYIDVDVAEFYANYTPAISASDAYYRTQHNLMSGDISAQNQAPTVAENRPTENGLYIRNTSALYSNDMNTYFVLDADGKVVNRIYRDGAYVTLEEVAAYLIAFGEIPSNYSGNKKTKPTESPWGEYLRVNHTKFTGNTFQYPYEPELPDISGCGGDITYYEIDIGTTGTDCDPAYRAVIYNDGTKITRGAARIVYTRYDANGDHIIDVNERYVFYTYNHYNDFQEYLNYEGGWGEMFGNITGGGAISDKFNCNPTPYVAVVRDDFTRPHFRTVYIVAVLPYYTDKFSLAA